MPTFGCDRPDLSRHYRYFEARCRAKGAGERKAHEWARQQVRKGKRAPETTVRRSRGG